MFAQSDFSAVNRPNSMSAIRVPPVDIVIRVYNAPDDLARCVDSVLVCTDAAHRLILIDDASPDPAIGRYFETLEGQGLPQLVLLRNETRRGFAGTVNLGMRHGERERADVVLLDSGTAVTRGWLAALLRCARSSPRIGTITPFSNNADVGAFACFGAGDRWTDGADPELLRAALGRAAVPTWPELPTGAGFCMLICRDLIECIGYLDEEAFGTGCDAGNDYCLRGFRAGYRNVLCDDAFVLHLDARPFEGRNAEPTPAKSSPLQQRHPHYNAMVRDFVARDPLRPIREAALAQLRCASGPVQGVLHIIHGHGGGTERHVRSLIEATRARCRHYLAIAVGEIWQVEEHLDDGRVRTFALCRPSTEPMQDFLGGLCATFRIGIAHLHNISGCREGLADALRALRIPWGYTAHDLSFGCPTITFHGRDGLFCGGETNAVVCRACLAAQPSFAAIDIVGWRAQHLALVAGASFLIAPSRWAAEMLGRYFPGSIVDVIPHSAPGAWASQTLPDGDVPRSPAAPALTGVPLPDDDVPTVAVIGAIGPDKGARRLERLADLARAHGIKLRFVVIGYLDLQHAPWQSPDAMLTVHGRYEVRDLPALLAFYRVRLVAYPSAGPETFSFTLSETWASGRPVVVPPFGALAERVGATGAGFLLTEGEWRSEEAMLARIQSILADGDALASVSAAARAVDQPTVEAMAERTFAHYAALGAHTPPAFVPLSPQRIRDALGYSPWRPPEPAAGNTALPDVPSADEIAPGTETDVAREDGRRSGLARAASRLRRTLLGRVLRRLLPEVVIAGLKARLR